MTMCFNPFLKIPLKKDQISKPLTQIKIQIVCEFHV